MFIYDLMHRNSQVAGENVAFKDPDNEITYRQLHSFAIQAGTYIYNTCDQQQNQPIVVFIDRNIESVQAFMAVVYSGNYYVPIDINQPTSRIDLILETLNPILIINATDKQLADIEFSEKVIRFAELADFENGSVETIEAIQSRLIDTDPLYAMFTSGSTGVPKGVLISYGSVLDMAEEFTKEFGFTEDTIFGNQAPFDFDVSVKDIYNAIYIAAKVVIIPQVNFSFPNMLIDFLNEYEINTGIWATSVLRIVENLNGFQHDVPKTLKKVMFSGEVMPNKVLNYWRKHLTDAEYVNLYGPTEITCNCSFYKVDRPFEDDEVLPIGVPFHNTRIVLLDENDQLVTEPNAQGEICVLGRSLALGYVNNREITEEVFIQNPLNKGYDERMYRTGDIGYWNEEGLLMYASRKDHQIKHMGHRIELGEIEIQITALEYIQAAVCIYDTEKEKIVLFYTSETGDRKQIYKDMLTKVPKYMIPNKMIKLDEIPLNNNRKFDRKLLEKRYYDGEY